MSRALVVSVQVTDADGALASTAPAGVRIEAGDATAELRLGTRDDTVSEATAEVVLALRPDAAYALGTPSEATVSVRDDDPPVVTVAADMDAVVEGADAVFTLTRVGDLSAALDVSIQVTDAGSLLTATPPAGVSFGAGAAEATLRLGTEEDAPGNHGADRPVTLTLVDGADYDLGTPSRATVTVRDDDEAPEVSIADPEPVTEGGTLEFPVTLSRPYNEAIRVFYQLNQDGTDTAKRGTDYTDVTVVSGDRTLSFAPGELRKTISLATVDDGDYEGEETVSVDILYDESYRPDPPVFLATGRILDNDIPVVTVAADAATVTEGEDAVFTLTRAGDLSVEVEVPITVTDAGAGACRYGAVQRELRGRGRHGRAAPGHGRRRDGRAPHPR